MKINLVDVDVSFLDKTWEWLNDPEIKALTNTPSFTKEDQKKWFDNLEFKKDFYKVWGIECDNIHIGMCDLKNITKEDCEYWGYIGKKEFWGKGIGKTIMNNLISYAKEIKLSSIYLKVIKDNTRAIRLYSKMNFKEEGIEEDGLIKMRLAL